MKNIVICCDGTGNEINTTISNVLKLYRILGKNAGQRVYYNPGVGTIGQQNAWQRWQQKARGVFGLATGLGLDDDVLSAYRFLVETYEEGDQVWLFGFSRGAYTVRVLAAFTQVIGLLPPDQINLAGYALGAYKRASLESHRGETAAAKAAPADDAPAPATDLATSSALEEAWHFGRVAGTRPVRYEFVGVWDTVASIIAPRDGSLLPDLQTLRYTRTNPSVKTFRQAIAIDEKRRMFRLNRWTDPQKFRPNPFQPASEVDQDIRQVWFAGVHADVGGGYPETVASLSKFPLHWMVEQAAAKGLKVNRAMINHLVLGQPRKGSNHDYVEPDVNGPINISMTAGWKPLEWIPKRVKWREWPARRALLGFYLPRGEPRPIPDGALIHWSVLARRASDESYRPVNLPARYQVEDFPPWDGRAATEKAPEPADPGAASPAA